MVVTIDLFTVTKKTSLSDVINLLNRIETASRSFNKIKNRRSFIIGCLSACGFDYRLNFASKFANIPNISSDWKIYRLPYSCTYGCWNSRYCVDVDISMFK